MLGDKLYSINIRNHKAHSWTRNGYLKPFTWSYSFTYWKQLSAVLLNTLNSPRNKYKSLLGVTEVHKSKQTAVCKAQNITIYKKNPKSKKKKINKKKTTVRATVAWKSKIVTVTKQHPTNPVCNGAALQKLLRWQQLLLLYLQ